MLFSFFLKHHIFFCTKNKLITGGSVKLSGASHLAIMSKKSLTDDKLVKSRIPMATKKDPNSRRANPE